MNMTELKTKSEDELKANLMDLRKEQFNLRFQRSTGSLEDTSRFRKIRVEIARIKTLLNQDKYGKKASTK